MTRLPGFGSSVLPTMHLKTRPLISPEKGMRTTGDNDHDRGLVAFGGGMSSAPLVFG